ncbi:MAG: hypothetical protein REJ23_06495 [Brevundimonas sp.]|nr:hypothetical protein [Brevundimonas sp.]
MTGLITGTLAALILITPQQAPATPETPSVEQLIARLSIPYAERERAVYEDVLVLARGDSTQRPQCGYFISKVAVKGRLPSGETTFFYVTWCAAGQAMPPVSGRCRFEVVLMPGADGFVSGEHDMPAADMPLPSRLAYVRKDVEQFDCTISSDSPTIEPAETSVWDFSS